MLTSEFDYELPKELIAQEPPKQRGTSRMLVVHRGSGLIQHRMIGDIAEFLSSDDLMVLNDTKVFPARLQGSWSDSGGALELLLLYPLALAENGVDDDQDRRWLCMCGSGRKVRMGLNAIFADGALRAEIVECREEGFCVVVFHSIRNLMSLLEEHGLTPVPPYIKRLSDNRLERLDRERYQTIYAKERGAVAAPTAGLHFTDEIFAGLDQRGIRRQFLTLHVGPGTFKPVKSEFVKEHRMDAEHYAISEKCAAEINACRANGGRVVCVGSTTVRTLESVAACFEGNIRQAKGCSSIFIYPPFDFRVTDVMLTNFHLPRSTLIMMVCALAGRDLIMRAYQQAVSERYRFFSYGDCMLIL
jgi:S-adenosylmethionine:tRNA ribosyltransferase-isomerase